MKNREHDLRSRERHRPNRAGNYIGAAICNVVLLVVLNRLPHWNVPFLLDSYGDLLWVINLSLGVQLAGNCLLIIFHPLYLHHLTQAIFSGVSALAIWRIYQVFPFDLSRVSGSLPWFGTALRVLFMVVFVATVFGGSLSFYKFLRTLFFPPEER